jgi:hypothetical protein
MRSPHRTFGKVLATAALLLVVAACDGWRFGPPPDSPWLGRVSFALAADSGRDLPFGPLNPDPSGRYTVEDDPLPGGQPASTLFRPGPAPGAASQPAALDVQAGQTEERTNDTSSFHFTLYGYRGPGAYTVAGDGSGIDVHLLRGDGTAIGRWTSDDWRPPAYAGKSWPGASCAVRIGSDRAGTSHGFRELEGTFSCQGLVRWGYQTQHAEVRDGRLDLFAAERWCTSLTPPATISTTC